MANLTQTPGELNIKTTRDNFSMLVDFDISLTGYTFDAAIVHKGSDVKSALTVTNTNLASGQITISADDSALLAIPLDKHFWYLRWTDGSGNVRRVLAGDFELAEK